MSIPAPRTGLSSILTSVSIRGGVAGLTGVLAPNTNPFDTSVPLLLPEGVPKSGAGAAGVGVVAPGAGDGVPNINFFSGIGVDGAEAPKAKGDFAGVGASTVGALGVAPNEKGEVGVVVDVGALPNSGLGA